MISYLTNFATRFQNIIPHICHGYTRVNFFWPCKFLQILREKVAFFYRFNAKNWRFSVYILFSKNFARVKKMTNIRYAYGQPDCKISMFFMAFLCSVVGEKNDCHSWPNHYNYFCFLIFNCLADVDERMDFD